VCSKPQTGMYTLLSGLYKHLTQKDEYFILILGLDNAGKTTFLESAKTKLTPNHTGANLSRITTTVGLNLGKIDIDGVRLNFWDLGGQTELQALWDKYYQECHAVIYVVDSGDGERIEQSKTTFSSMIKSVHLCGVPLLVAANKQDLSDCMGVREVKPLFEECVEEVGSREVMTLATSGLEGLGVREGIEWVAQAVARNSIDRPPHDTEQR